MKSPNNWAPKLARSKWMVIPLALIALGLLAAGALAVGMQPTRADHVPVHVDVLAPHSEFPDQISGQFRIKLDKGGTKVINVRDPDHVLLARLTLAPEASVGWHTHPGPVIVAVAEGALSIINASDCVLRVYEAGQSFIDPGHGNVHVGFNASTTEDTVVYATFLEVPAGSPPTIPADDPGC